MPPAEFCHGWIHQAEAVRQHMPQLSCRKDPRGDRLDLCVAPVCCIVQGSVKYMLDNSSCLVFLGLLVIVLELKLAARP